MERAKASPRKGKVTQKRSSCVCFKKLLGWGYSPVVKGFCPTQSCGFHSHHCKNNRNIKAEH